MSCVVSLYLSFLTFHQPVRPELCCTLKKGTRWQFLLMKCWRHKSNIVLISEKLWNRKSSLCSLLLRKSLYMNEKSRDLNWTSFLQLFCLSSTLSKEEVVVHSNRHLKTCHSWIRYTPCSWSLQFTQTPAHEREKPLPHV